jgi:hypothetical protein
VSLVIPVFCGPHGALEVDEESVVRRCRDYAAQLNLPWADEGVQVSSFRLWPLPRVWRVVAAIPAECATSHFCIRDGAVQPSRVWVLYSAEHAPATQAAAWRGPVACVLLAGLGSALLLRIVGIPIWWAVVAALPVGFLLLRALVVSGLLWHRGGHRGVTPPDRGTPK